MSDTTPVSEHGGTMQSDRDTLIAAFAMLTPAERQLITCALAGNHPERLAPLRMEVLRGLARADRPTPANGGSA